MQFNHKFRIQLVDKDDTDLSVRRQCEILSVNRRSLYYHPQENNPFDIEVREAIRLIYASYPFYGHSKVTKKLRRMGFEVNHKRVRRIRIEIGLRTIFPGPNTSKPRKEHKKYPYLLKNYDITHPNDVWATDISVP